MFNFIQLYIFTQPDHIYCIVTLLEEAIRVILQEIHIVILVLIINKFIIKAILIKRVLINRRVLMGQLNSMCQHKRDNSRHALKERNDERSDRYLNSEVLDNAEDGVAARVPDVQALVLPLRAPLSDGTVGGVEEATAVELTLNGDAGSVGRGVPRLAGKGGHVVGACGSDNPHCELKEQNEPQNRSKLLKQQQQHYNMHLCKYKCNCDYDCDWNCDYDYDLNRDCDYDCDYDLNCDCDCDCN